MSALPQSREARELASSKLKEKDGCLCESPARTREIRFCDLHHRYFFGQEKFDSVSSVIRTMMPSAYDTVDPAVLENARVRGQLIDKYFSEYVMDVEDLATLDEFQEMIEPFFRQDQYKKPNQHADNCRLRLEALLNWWERRGNALSTGRAVVAQEIVYDEQKRVAGTLDIGAGDAVYDIKVVSKLQPTYKLQLGAYASMRGASEVGIIHVAADKVGLVRYPVDTCILDWLSCWNWFDTRRRLTA
jgi:hypothetical protein